VVRVQSEKERTQTLDPFRHERGSYEITVTLCDSSGFLRRFAGHLENGPPSINAPTSGFATTEPG
jgi:hypothetical protein